MDLLPPTFNGKPLIHAWEYTTNGQIVGYAGRYENGEGEKEIIPFFKPNGHTWKPGAPPEPRPLYGADNLDTSRVVFVVEGEKTAQALHYMGLQAVTSLGGCNAAGKSDWSPLSDCKKVCLLPDNDEAGQVYMKCVSGILGRKDLIIVDLPELPEKGDVVGWIQARINYDGYNDDPAIEALSSAFKNAIANSGFKYTLCRVFSVFLRKLK